MHLTEIRRRMPDKDALVTDDGRGDCPAPSSTGAAPSLQVVVRAAAPRAVEVERQVIEWFGQRMLEYYAGSEVPA